MAPGGGLKGAGFGARDRAGSYGPLVTRARVGCRKTRKTGLNDSRAPIAHRAIPCRKSLHSGTGPPGCGWSPKPQPGVRFPGPPLAAMAAGGRELWRDTANSAQIGAHLAHEPPCCGGRTAEILAGMGASGALARATAPGLRSPADRPGLLSSPGELDVSYAGFEEPTLPRRGGRGSPLASLRQLDGRRLRLSPRLPGPGVVSARCAHDTQDVYHPGRRPGLAGGDQVRPSSRGRAGADSHHSQ
jgi:hypothetical protein